MNKIFFDDEPSFINALLNNKNNVGIVYCDSFNIANYIRNEFLAILLAYDELMDNKYIMSNNIFKYNLTGTIYLKNNSSILFISKIDNNMMYKIRGIYINKVLFKSYPNDDFFKYLIPLIRNINNE